MENIISNEKAKLTYRYQNVASIRRCLRILHRTLGLFGSLIILPMSCTGLLLNHKSLIGYSSNTQMKLQELIFAFHTGSIGGQNLTLVTDFSAICMIVLSISGIWMWTDMFIKKFKKGRRKS